ncbi:NAD(P)H-binding protein [Streptomyces viridosporus]|uniref:NAD(P)H-binding protein n=1 Tax=Streptomyces viridosporus TaxID=67581 RepID=UPI003332F730
MIAVTGATGNIGRPLVSLLAEAGEQVTAVSRNTPGFELPEGVTHQRADLGDAESLRPSLEGAEALLVLLGGRLNAFGESPETLLDVVKSSGVKRVVLVSSQIVGTRPDAISHGRLRRFEETVQQSGLEWGILRPGGFASNAFAWAESVRTRRTIAAPFADVALPVIDPADIAAAADVVLRDGRHSGGIYELTGPEAITPRRQAEEIGRALGESVDFVELTREQAREGMLQFMPEPVVEGTLDILGTPRPREQQVSPAVEQLVGRPARPFGEWVARNVAAFE